MTNEEQSKRMGERIAALRKEREMTQVQLANDSGLTQAHISRIEDGRYDVRLSVLSRIAEALGCTVELIKQ